MSQQRVPHIENFILLLLALIVIGCFGFLLWSLDYAGLIKAIIITVVQRIT